MSYEWFWDTPPMMGIEVKCLFLYLHHRVLNPLLLIYFPNGLGSPLPTFCVPSVSSPSNPRLNPTQDLLVPSTPLSPRSPGSPPSRYTSYGHAHITICRQLALDPNFGP